MTITSEFEVDSHVYTLIENKPVECIVRCIEFPKIYFMSRKEYEDDWMVVYHLVTKAEEDKRRDLGMSILGEDYQFTRKAEEVASSPKTLFDKILDKLQNKS